MSWTFHSSSATDCAGVRAYMDQVCCTGVDREQPTRKLLLRNQRSHTAHNTLGLRCARFARWPAQAPETGRSGKAPDTPPLTCR